MMMKRNSKRYTSHRDIPAVTAEYLKTVAKVRSVYELSLYEINVYLDGLDEFYSEVA